MATDTVGPVDIIRVSLTLIVPGDSPSFRSALGQVTNALSAADIRLAPNTKCKVERLDPNPKRRPHAMAAKRADPCPECGSHWQRLAIDTSDPDAEEFPTFGVCAFCGHSYREEVAHAE